MRISNKLIVFVIALNFFVISSSLAADFNFTTTEDFINGTRQEIAYSYGFPPSYVYLDYYTMETCEDNLLVPCGSIRPSSRMSDAFGDAHLTDFTANADSDWKWLYNENQYSSSFPNNVTFHDGVMTQYFTPDSTWSGEIYLFYGYKHTTLEIKGEFNITIDFLNYDPQGYNNVYFGVMIEDTGSFFGNHYSSTWVSTEGGTEYIIDDNSLYYQWEYNTWDGSDGSLRFERVNDSGTILMNSYMLNTTDDTWILIDSYDDTEGSTLTNLDQIVYFHMYTAGEGFGAVYNVTQLSFDNLTIETSEDYLVGSWWHSDVFGSGTSSWTSSNITLGENTLESITVNYTNADDYTNLKNVCIKQGGTLIGCKDYSYENTTTSGTGVTLTESDFDFATYGYEGFVNITDDFNIYIIVNKLATEGYENTGVIITEVSGEFEEESLPPTVSNLVFDEDIEDPDEYIDLSAGSTQTVTCFGLISDPDGYGDIVSANATIYSNSSSLESADNRNSHYTNSSCALSSGFDTTKKNATCTFEVYYYAEPVEWTCELFGTDNSGLNDSNATNATMNALIALNIEGNINFGDITISEISDEVNVSIANYGNAQIDIEVSGTNMDCDLGAINVTYIKYNTTDYGQDYTESMTSLTDSPSLRTEFDLPKKTTTDESLTTKNLSLRLKMPFGVKGNCTGSMQFTAYAG